MLAAVPRSQAGALRVSAVCVRALGTALQRAVLGTMQRVEQKRGEEEAEEEKAEEAAEEEVVLDRTRFDEDVRAVAVRVRCRDCNRAVAALKEFLFRDPPPLDRKPVGKEDGEGMEDWRRIYLQPGKVDSTDLRQLPDAVRRMLLDELEEVQVFESSVRLGYESRRTDEVLKTLLGERVADIPSSFEQAGHIAHFNLRDEMLPYKRLLGQVVLDKNYPTIRTVVNKVSSIETIFRTFPLELLAGEDNMMVELNESGARFRFDFSQVYWNSRLQMEHRRIIDLIPTGSVVCDMFAGVGPFAVPLGMRGCTTYANDLNPHSFRFLVENIERNKLSKVAPARPAPTASSVSVQSPSSPLASLTRNNKRPRSTVDGAAAASAVSPSTATTAAAAAATAAVSDRDFTEPGNSSGAAESDNEHGQAGRRAKKGRADSRSGRRRARAMVAKAPVIPFNMDGREFVRALAERGVVYDHVIMNLPRTAVEFLDVFRGVGRLYENGATDKGAGRASYKPPRIHVYGFSNDEHPVEAVVRQVSEVLHYPLPPPSSSGSNASEPGLPGSWSAHAVRDVGPNTLMVCLSFDLPLEVALSDNAPEVPPERDDATEEEKEASASAPAAPDEGEGVA